MYLLLCSLKLDEEGVHAGFRSVFSRSPFGTCFAAAPEGAVLTTAAVWGASSGGETALVTARKRMEGEGGRVSVCCKLNVTQAST